MQETAIDIVKGEKICTVYTSEKKWMKKLLEMKEDYPELVDIKTYYNVDDNSIDGMEAKAPSEWFKFISPRHKRNLTEEQKANCAERMKKAREAKGAK